MSYASLPQQQAPAARLPQPAALPPTAGILTPHMQVMTASSTVLLLVVHSVRPSVRLSVRSSRLLFLSDVHRHIGVLNMKDWSMQPGHLVPHFSAVHLLPCGHSWSSIFRSCILTHPTPSYFSCTLLTDHCGCGVKPSGLICMSTRSTQPCISPGSLNQVPASAGVKAGRSPLSGGR